MIRQTPDRNPALPGCPNGHPGVIFTKKDNGMKKILCIGNSFGDDSQRYLWGVARADGKEIKCVNLFIGGCSLYRHYRNMLSEEEVYNFAINGHRTDLMVSLKHALLMDEWDVIYTQQCSPHSGEPETYQPYANALAEYVHKMAPKAKLYIMQTWTFERETPRFKLTSFTEPEPHFAAIKDCYWQMFDDIKADGMFPCGEAMYTMWERKAQYGIEKVHRDGFHAEYGIGRYLLALTIWGTLSGKDVRENTFSDFDVEVTPEQAQHCREVAAEIVEKYRPLVAERIAAR